MRAEDFDRLYDEHAASLFSFLAYRTGNRATAEDIVADTFERALRARVRFDPRRGSEKTWLYSIALNRLRDQARRAGVEQRALTQLGSEAADDDDGSGAAMERVATRETLQVALRSLSDEEREAIALRFGADLTLKEIAKVTGERMTTVEGRVYRALRKLRESLDEQG
jgi:RNA polymerase sigma factor (sigma-70 family)